MSARPKRGTFRARLSQGGTTEVDGWILGDWATRKENYAWRFTHLPTGIQVAGPWIEKKAEALAELERLDQEGLDGLSAGQGRVLSEAPRLTENRGRTRDPWEVVFDPRETVPKLQQRIVVMGRTNRPKRMPTVRTPQDVAAVVGSAQLLDREAFYVLPLGPREKLIGVYVAHIGGTAMTIVEWGVVLRMLLVVQAQGAIVVHNHPSGLTDPSQEDRTLTAGLVEAMEVFGMVLVDHVIVGTEGPFSFREAGLLR